MNRRGKRSTAKEGKEPRSAGLEADSLPLGQRGGGIGDPLQGKHGATCGVMVSTSAFLACHQCGYGFESRLGLEFSDSIVCDIF